MSVFAILKTMSASLSANAKIDCLAAPVAGESSLGYWVSSVRFLLANT